jgi:hypothetical protein
MSEAVSDRYAIELRAAALIAAANFYAIKTGEGPGNLMEALASRPMAGDPTPAEYIAEFAKELLNAYSPLPPLPRFESQA